MANQYQDTRSKLLRQQISFHPLKALAGLLIGPGIVIAALFIFGQPGLRISYTWNGNAANPLYGHCDYVTATGWESARVHCPVVQLFPVRM